MTQKKPDFMTVLVALFLFGVIATGFVQINDSFALSSHHETGKR
ncbi:hypothetical protein [Zooshikella sp. RANM57]